MADTILVGSGTDVHPVPAAHWRQHLRQARPHIRQRLDFMMPEHHAVRNFVVTELPRRARPLAPADISRALSLPASRVAQILDELEPRLFFLVRNRAGQVSWAFPVTSDRTPHRIRFSTGERIFAA